MEAVRILKVYFAECGISTTYIYFAEILVRNVPQIICHLDSAKCNSAYPYTLFSNKMERR